jgi:hypothetical protein
MPSWNPSIGNGRIGQRNSHNRTVLLDCATTRLAIGWFYPGTPPQPRRCKNNSTPVWYRGSEIVVPASIETGLAVWVHDERKQHQSFDSTTTVEIIFDETGQLEHDWRRTHQSRWAARFGSESCHTPLAGRSPTSSSRASWGDGRPATQCHIDVENHSTHYRVGKWEPLFLLLGVVTFQHKSSSPSLLACLSSPTSFVSQSAPNTVNLPISIWFLLCTGVIYLMYLFRSDLASFSDFPCFS